jgi:hypothetical protein
MSSVKRNWRLKKRLTTASFSRSGSLPLLWISSSQASMRPLPTPRLP